MTATAHPIATARPEAIARHDGHQGWSSLAVISAAHLMAILDVTVMFVALPTAQRALSMSPDSRQWVLSAYTLAFAALLLPGGRLADRLGARRTLVVGTIGFAAASAVGGAAVDGTMLIAARAVQGGFAALLTSSTKSLLARIYVEEEQRRRALGIFAATLTAGMALGLVVGGVLTAGPGWRWCLYLNVVVCLFVVPAALRLLPRVASRPAVRLDLAGSALCGVGMVALVLGLSEATTEGWASTVVAASLAGAVIAFVCFVAREAGSESPVLPPAVVRDRGRGGALLAMVVNGLSTVGMMLLLTFQLQSVMRWSPLATGLALIPFALAAAFASAVLARRLTARVAPRRSITMGVGLSAAGLVPLLGLTPTGHYLPLILLAELVEGLGTGLAGPAILQSALHGVAPGDTGAAAAASSAAGQLGSSLGTALLGTIAAAAAAAYLAAHPAAGAAPAAVHGYVVAVAWGVAVLLVALMPIFLLLEGDPTRPRSRRAAIKGRAA